MSKPVMIDTFCGAGGLGLGFEKYFDTLMAIERGKMESRTFSLNHPEINVINDDINNVLQKKLPDTIDLLIGGPPCQSFSIANNSEKRLVDNRRVLWRSYFEVAEKCNATAFLMENVNVLLTRKEFKDIVFHAKNIGYDVRWSLLKASDYGAATTRKRLFIFGRKGKIKSNWPPMQTHKKKVKNESMGLFQELFPWVTLRDVIGDLPVVALPENKTKEFPLNLHYPCHMPIDDVFLKYVPPESDWRLVDRKALSKEDPVAVSIIDQSYLYMKSYSRKKWDWPCNTLTTIFHSLLAHNRPGHPTENRSLTLREGARVMGFPDDYIFCGNTNAIAKQIGNAVNVKMASVLAEWVYNELFSSN